MSYSHQYPTRAHRGMVAAGDRLAALAGTEILMKGGNAVDAALAAAGVTMVTMPDMCGLGGDAFILVHLAAKGMTFGVSGSGMAPLGATPEAFRGCGYDTMPLDGILSAAVPGAPAACQEAWTRWGSMDWQTLWEPALFYARSGFPVTERLSRSIRENEDKLRRCPDASRTLRPGGSPPDPGQTLVQEELGASLETLAVEGSEPFYRGSVSERYVEHSRQLDGLFEGPEFTSHTTDIYPSMTVDYRGHTIHQTRPPSQGIIMLEALALLSGWDLGPEDGDAGDRMHLMIEATKIAFADRISMAGDPAMVPFVAEDLLAEGHLEARRLLIDQGSALPWPGGLPDGDTTSLVVVDAWGNAVSFIHSLSLAFGSGVMVPETGILLNNRAGRGFTLEDGHPNQIAPRKRTMHTLNTYLVTRGDELVLVGNTPGGDGQPQWNLQVLANVIDDGMGAQAAVSAPRWTIFPGSDPANAGKPAVLKLERGISPTAAEDLIRRGHPVGWAEPWSGGGSAQLIVARDGSLEGGSDPRGAGAAVGF